MNDGCVFVYVCVCDKKKNLSPACPVYCPPYVCVSVFVPLDEVLYKPPRPVCFESKHGNSKAIHDPQENTQVCVCVSLEVTGRTE